MFRFTRRVVKFFIKILVFVVIIYMIYWSGPVQRFLYPIPQRDFIFSYSTQYELDPYLIAAVIRVESRFSHLAESDSGARGLMQVMPETAQWVAEKMGIEYSPEMLFDPRYNIRIGCWYLKDLIEKFDGNLVTALAAYNGGRGNVSTWLKEGIWNGEYSQLKNIPFTETRIYVERVIRDYNRYQKIYSADAEE